MGKDIGSFDLPYFTDIVELNGEFREINDELSVDVGENDLCACDSLNPNQRAAFDEIMRYLDDNQGGVFFIDGPGGTGKTYLYKALLAKVRSRGLIALATASSGAAVNNLPGGRTAHSRFKIPLQLDNKLYKLRNHFFSL
jgi:PIF1-like helicase